jgi:hypothetical protein
MDEVRDDKEGFNTYLRNSRKEVSTFLYLSYVDVRVEHRILVNFDNKGIYNDKHGHENQNLHVHGKVVNIVLDKELIKDDREVVFVAPLRSFDSMLLNAKLDLTTLTGWYSLVFKRHNGKSYELLKYDKVVI